MIEISREKRFERIVVSRLFTHNNKILKDLLDAVFKKVILIGLILELHIEILGCPGETFEWRRGEMRSRIHCGKRTHKFYGSAYPEHPNYASVSLVRL